MKFMKWKILIISSVVCLLPILLGLAMWNSLPDAIAIHFDFYGNPDNYAKKGFVVFGLPALMVVLQAFCCFVNDLNAHKFGERKKFEMATKWIIPAMSIVLQVATLGYSVGWNIDIRKVAAVVVGGIFVVIGNYMPKFDRIKNYDLDSEKARKVNRFIGYESVVMGVLFLISAFLPPVSTLICLMLLIPYAIISIIYGIKTARK